MDGLCELFARLAAQYAPLPVAAARAGGVHAAALAKAQIVLHLCDKQPALAAHAAADDAGVEALLVIETEVLLRERDVRLIRLRAPEGEGRVVVRALREQIEQKKASLETSLAEQQSAKETLVAKKSELNTQRTEAEKVLAELKANEAQYKQVLSEKDAAMERQQAEIVRLSRELAEKNGNTTVTYGGYIWPCSSKYITSPLGARYTGIAGASRNHAGIDIGRVGYTTQAVAAKAGTVIISAYNKYRGNYVVVSHGSGNTTTYQHLSSRSVSVGTYVAQGQVVGITGTTGVSSGPHLHFEITENGKIINPLKYLTDYIKGW